MKSGLLRPRYKFWVRASLFLAGIMILGLVYIFQRVSLADLFGLFQGGDLHPNIIFIINRTLRLMFNDLACFLIIYALFQKKKYLKIAFWVFLAELLVILPLYLIIKLTFEGDSEISSPLLSQVHRLIVNPMLMILLMVGFFYQEFFNK
ncbi:MAG: hypothetical protein ABIR06_16610 [Cyclobacteriaceae bacterium]